MTAFQLAQRFVGEIHERKGTTDNHPFIVWCLSLCGLGESQPDETAWCSAFCNGICWMLRLPRSKSAAARSWLRVGLPVTLDDARVGDIVILKRGEGEQPGPEVIAAPGHVGFLAGYAKGSATLQVLGGNQGDGVSVAYFAVDRILGIRRVTGV
jgi:uncharacterized protein (TIGR02594 family)